ncbi:MAG: hypothetical protein A3G38_00610 [Omnitrophica WOR_2 bacterium RIFCSPLOWO2_12_FULL_51_8]|nr:MAG: hypothetical protein A3G38_00610 [Omnitrophica WOR_2 bacterium RIFCSPLOWO2_12_FULL_51_8]
MGLEWARLPWQDKATFRRVKSIANEIAKKYAAVISLGIGGSYLGIRAAQDALAPPYYNEFAASRKKRPQFFCEGNNLDPDTLRALLKNLNPKKTFLIVISKSGETAETKAAFAVAEDWLKKGAGIRYGRQILAVTDPESGALRNRVNAEQKRDSLSFRGLPLLKGVGGRFSEFNMGLLHLAIIGVDIAELFAGAREMSSRCGAADLSVNPAAMYAALHTILYRKKGKAIALMMPFSETLKATADWYAQLLGESLGKKCGRKIAMNRSGEEEWLKDETNIVNVGRTPVSCRGTGDLHSIQQNNIEGENNKITTFIRVEKFRDEVKVPGKGDILAGRTFTRLICLAQEATEWALVQESRPNCTIIMPEVSPYHWGALLYFFEMATAFEGELLEVNAYDQPGVEGYKNYMYYRLGRAGMPEAISRKIENHPLIKDPKFIV